MLCIQAHLSDMEIRDVCDSIKQYFENQEVRANICYMTRSYFLFVLFSHSTMSAQSPLVRSELWNPVCVLRCIALLWPTTRQSMDREGCSLKTPPTERTH